METNTGPATTFIQIAALTSEMHEAHILSMHSGVNTIVRNKTECRVTLIQLQGLAKTMYACAQPA